MEDNKYQDRKINQPKHDRVLNYRVVVKQACDGKIGNQENSN